MPYKHTNSLINESSPYLQQHAHNPVNWYPWGEEALQKAVTENKVILVSIGYAACHWCHVMERESFENEVVAEKMNRHFVNIKIDREERPDLDHIYMDAVQAMTGSGGWPLNVFLTPGAIPFYGGTYFPPVKAYNRSSWTEVIEAIAAAWKERPNEIASQAENLLEHLKQQGNLDKLSATNARAAFSKQQCSNITANVLKQADTVWGGFGKAPKFPQTFTIQYLLQYYHYTKDEKALQQALLSVNKMMEGGIYDHAGGGFARYSTDAEWLAPHFEKMLYDNALLLNVLCDAYQLTGMEKYAKTIHHTIAFLQREMMHPQGGFYAALDADSEGEEGKFYVWSKEEVDALLDKESALFCEFYDVTANGNWEGKNILRILKDAEIFAAEKKLDATVFTAGMDRALCKLLEKRNSRTRPGTDDKILLGWNSLLITSLCKTAAALGDEAYLKLATGTFDFVFNSLGIAGEEGFYHTFKDGVAKYPAFLDDYAFLIQACIRLQEVTSDMQYLEKAAVLTRYVITNFYDSAAGCFMFTHKDQRDVILRKKEMYDGATPSGNSVMAENLFYLSVIFENRAWEEMARNMVLSLKATVEKYPTSFGVWVSICLIQAFGVHELVVTGPEFVTLRKELLAHYIPGKVLQCGSHEEEKYPLLRGKNQDMKNNIYWCRQYECKAPFAVVEDLFKALEKWNYSTNSSQ